MGAPDYYKSILLYGLYNGAPVPLACDEQGRLILVTELVSPFGKTGTILLQDNFSDGLVHVKSSTSGVGASVALDDTMAISGGFSCKLTGGAGAGNYAKITYFTSPSTMTKIGLELCMVCDEFTAGFFMGLDVYTGDRSYVVSMKYVPADRAWYIYDFATSQYVKVRGGFIFLGTANEFVRVKLVLDIENERYHTLRLANDLIDLSAYALPDQGITINSCIYAHIYNVSLVGGGGAANVDNIIITQDES